MKKILEKTHERTNLGDIHDYKNMIKEVKLLLFILKLLILILLSL